MLSNAEKSGQRITRYGNPACGPGKFASGGIDLARGGIFCTPVHRFAQGFDQILIDGANGNFYLAPQIEPGSFRTLRISLEGAANLIVVAPRD